MSTYGATWWPFSLVTLIEGKCLLMLVSLWASTSYPCPISCWHHRGKVSALRRVWCRGVLVQRCWVGTVLYSNFVRFGTISTLGIFVHHFRISKCEALFLRSWEWYVFASKYGCWVGFLFCKKEIGYHEGVYYCLILEMSYLYKYNKNNLNDIQMCQGLIILR